MNHPLRFGLKLSGQDTTIEALRAVWRIADEAGFDHVWDFDHLASIGAAGPTPLDDRDYQVPFPFTGKIDKVTIAVDRPKLTPDDVKKFEAAERAAQDAN